MQVGNTFSLTTVFNGNESQMKYKLEEMERPHRIVVSGYSDIIKGVDTILLRPANEENTKTYVDYTADLTLKGFRRPFIAFISGSLNELGRNAMEGMTKSCAELFASK